MIANKNDEKGLSVINFFDRFVIKTFARIQGHKNFVFLLQLNFQEMTNYLFVFSIGLSCNLLSLSQLNLNRSVAVILIIRLVFQSFTNSMNEKDPQHDWELRAIIGHYTSQILLPIGKLRQASGLTPASGLLIWTTRLLKAEIFGSGCSPHLQPNLKKIRTNVTWIFALPQGCHDFTSSLRTVSKCSFFFSSSHSSWYFSHSSLVALIFFLRTSRMLAPWTLLDIVAMKRGLKTTTQTLQTIKRWAQTTSGTATFKTRIWLTNVFLVVEGGVGFLPYLFCWNSCGWDIYRREPERKT